VEPRILDARVVRFATFEVDLRSGEVRKGGVKLKLSGQPFQVLAILLERPGEVVTREELQKRLWPDTFVDVDHNLNTAINKIREVLGDEAENPRFVETLPRRGYRFIGPTEGKAARVEGIAKTRSRFRVVGAGLAGVALLGVAVLLFYLRPGSRPEVIPLVPLPFTSYVGTETAPAISRDGSRIAFAWNNNAATQSGGSISMSRPSEAKRSCV
jgi:DNA-binding winged helix-turn-helix (wHTH) protein